MNNQTDSISHPEYDAFLRSYAWGFRNRRSSRRKLRIRAGRTMQRMLAKCSEYARRYPGEKLVNPEYVTATHRVLFFSEFEMGVLSALDHAPTSVFERMPHINRNYSGNLT
jgi:hypothetical protein